MPESDSSRVVEEAGGRNLVQGVRLFFILSLALRLWPGSADVSPAPPARPAMQTSTAATAAHLPSLSAHQLAMQQQHLAETAGKTPVHELILQIKRLAFPASCNFVLGLLEK